MNNLKINIKNISKVFGHGHTKQVVLNNISFEFIKGKSYALKGVSGSGKSTLLHITGGLDEPTTGNVIYDNHDLYKLSETRKNRLLNKSFGFVFQFHYLVNELSVIENVMLPGKIGKIDSDLCYNRAFNLLRDVGLESKINSLPAKLSGGEQQRVSIARALFNKPDFIFADEPTGNLDKDNALRIMDIFIKCKQEWDLGVIIATHDINAYERMDVILSLDKGYLQLEKQ